MFSTDNVSIVHEQTLDELHHGAHYAHLDITCNNIMLRSGKPETWDLIRLLDLGLAEPSVTGMLCLHLLGGQSVKPAMLSPGSLNMFGCDSSGMVSIVQKKVGPGGSALKGAHQCMPPHSSCLPASSSLNGQLTQTWSHLMLQAIILQPRVTRTAKMFL